MLFADAVFILFAWVQVSLTWCLHLRIIFYSPSFLVVKVSKDWSGCNKGWGVAGAHYLFKLLSYKGPLFKAGQKITSSLLIALSAQTSFIIIIIIRLI